MFVIFIDRNDVPCLQAEFFFSPRVCSCGLVDFAALAQLQRHLSLVTLPLAASRRSSTPSIILRALQLWFPSLPFSLDSRLSHHLLQRDTLVPPVTFMASPVRSCNLREILQSNESSTNDRCLCSPQICSDQLEQHCNHGLPLHPVARTRQARSRILAGGNLSGLQVGSISSS